MKKWFWLLLALMVAVIVMIISSYFYQAETTPLVENVPVEQPQPQPTPAPERLVNAPLVSGEQLFNHVQQLNFQRYTDQERSLTRTYITNQLRKFGWQPRLEKFAEGINIVAERPGTNPAAGSILVGAHYDTVPASPGADDNGSGVAVLLELARLFTANPTPRTLQLVFFDQEEIGLLGSQAFVSQKSHLQNLQGAIILDMVGYACHTSGCQEYPSGIPVTPPSDKGDFLVVVGDTEHLPLLTAFAFANTKNSRLPQVLTVPIPLKGLLTPDALRSDHSPFWLQGIGAVLLTDTADFRNPNYHQSTDISKNIDQPFFIGSGQIIVNTVSNLLANTVSLSTPKPM